MWTNGMSVSKCHGLMVRAIFATRRQTGSDDRRPDTFLTQEAGMGGQELTDHGVHLGCEEGGGGWTLINTISYARCSTDRHTVHDIGEGLVAGPGQNKSDQTRPDQTDRLRSRSRVLCSWAERARDACSPPQASVLQSPRDLLRFVPLFSQDERKEEAVLGLLPAPLGRAMRFVRPIAVGVGSDS